MVTSFSTFATYLQAYGVMDFLLPFVLVFTIVYAVMEKSKILGNKKNFNVIIALVLALVFVVPHITGQYPLGYDPVQVMNDALPSISLVSIAAIMTLLLLGIFGKKFSQKFAPFIAVLSLGFIAYIFGAALNLWQGPYDIFYWWTPQTTELLIALITLGLIFWFITKEPSSGEGGIMNSGKKVLNGIGSWLEDIGGK